MRTIKIILKALLASALVAGTVFFIFFQTFDTDQFLPEMTRQISLVIGRTVSIKHIGLGLSLNGITLDAWPLRVADSRDFTSQPCIKVERVRISLDLASLLFKRQIHVNGVLLQSPQIHFIRSSTGVYNFQVQDAFIPSPLWGGSGRGKTTTLSFLAPSSTPFKQVSPKTGFNFPESHGAIAAKTSVLIQDAAISYIDQGRAMDFWLRDINVRLDGLTPPNPIRVCVQASFYSNYPNVKANALVFWDAARHSIKTDDLSLRIDFSRLDPDQLKDISTHLEDLHFLESMGGVVQLNLDHLQMDNSGGIDADGKITISNGIIKDFNIINAVLSRNLEILGGLENDIDRLTGKDTIIDKVQVKFSIHDNAVMIKDADIKTNALELNANGRLEKGMNADLQTTLHLNENISTALISQVAGLKFLCDDSGRISIGGELKGVIPHLKFKTSKDFKKKSKKAFFAAGGSFLGALFGSR